MRWRSAGRVVPAVLLACCAAPARAQAGDGGWSSVVIDLGYAGAPGEFLGAAVAAAGDVDASVDVPVARAPAHRARSRGRAARRRLERIMAADGDSSGTPVGL